jgi:hypothetical protein
MNWSLIEMEDEETMDGKNKPYVDKGLDRLMEKMAADINCNRMKARPRFKKKVPGE